jgi:hypothetical protein
VTFGADTADQAWYDAIEAEDAKDRDGWNDRYGSNRYEPRQPPNCTLVVGGVAVDLSDPTERTLPPRRFTGTFVNREDLTRGTALNAFLDAILARAEFTAIVWVQGRPQAIWKETT